MPLTFQAQPDEHQIAAAVRHAARRQCLPARLIAVPLLVVGAIGYADFGPLFLALSGLAALVVSVLMPWWSIRRATREAVRLMARPATYHFDRDGFGLANDLVRSDLSWELVTGSDELPGQTIIRVARNQFFAVPTADLSDAEHVELRDLLRSALL